MNKINAEIDVKKDYNYILLLNYFYMYVYSYFYSYFYNYFNKYKEDSFTKGQLDTLENYNYIECKVIHKNKEHHVIFFEENKPQFQDSIDKNIKNFLKDISNILSNRTKILHCSIVDEYDSYDVTDITDTFRKFVFYYNTTDINLDFFQKYIYKMYNNDSTNSIVLYKNDDEFSEISIDLKQCSNTTFSQLLN